jgi:acetyl-CoA C-acetyltransferase
MPEAYIVEALRVAGGRKNGALSGWHPADLAAEVLNAVIDRTGIDPVAVEDVIMGCVNAFGDQSGQIGRSAILASKLPACVPAVTVDRQCGSSQQALQFAAQAVMSGTQDMVIASGVESMSRVPMGSTRGGGSGSFTSRIRARFAVEDFSQFAGAQMIADKYGMKRDQLDAFALQSHERAAAATQSGAFQREIVPVEIRVQGGSQLHTRDEGIRHDASKESIAAVKLLRDGGTLTAATASQICDGASALLVANERALTTHNLTPLARIHNVTVTAGDPVIMLEEPIRATQRALKRAAMRIEDIDLYEVNEAFASVPLAWLQVIGADPAKLNVNGGAIALGHPLGASGAKLMATLIHALRARRKRYGLQTMCEGGGIANVTIIEAL